MNLRLSDLDRHLSIPRLAKYRSNAKDDTEALCLYLWNIELSEALQPTLHALEVTLRNSIHAAAITAFGVHDWFHQPTIVPLLTREQAMLDHATEQLWRAGKHNVGRIKQGLAPRPPLPAPDKYIAALTLGFWVALFGTPYRPYLWSDLPPSSPYGARKNLLARVFSRASRSERQQHRMHARLVDIRDFRNRISHHEPIWNWERKAGNIYTVEDQYHEMLKVVRWISPSTLAMLKLIDRFPQVYAHGPGHYLGEITLVP